MEHGQPGGATERRKRILEATERLLRRYGPAKTTVADIAREAEIAVGAVYLEFASKDAIVEELSQGQHRAVMAAARRRGRGRRALLRPASGGVRRPRALLPGARRLGRARV
jgi:AcrR family transcriptional regulator